MPFKRGAHGGRRKPADPNKPFTARVRGVELGDYATWDDAAAAEQSFLLRLAQLCDPELLTVRDYAENRWLQENARPSDDSNATLKSGIRAFVSEFGHMLLMMLTVGTVGGWVRSQTKKSALVAPRLMLSDAKYWGLIDENPIIEMRNPRRRRDETPPKSVLPPLTPSGVIRLENAAGKVLGPEWRAAVRFVSRQAPRRGEFGALMHDDIDLLAQTMRIERQMSHRAGVYKDPKWDSFRTVILLPDAAEAYEQVARRADPFVWHTIGFDRPLSRASLWRLWDDVRR
ncbi:MAG: hypothetical protein KY464_18605, partial [Gemmatimonadetes bacterium]|nr:hypothetical protein [Gemmatimonadota bacterium]